MASKPVDWTSTPNARRHRKMVHVTMSEEGIETIDKHRGRLSRGVYIELLLETTKGPDPHVLIAALDLAKRIKADERIAARGRKK